MTGFEPRISDVRSNHSTNCATTTTFFLSLFFHFPPTHDTTRCRPSLSSSSLLSSSSAVPPFAPFNFHSAAGLLSLNYSPIFCRNFFISFPSQLCLKAFAKGKLAKIAKAKASLFFLFSLASVTKRPYYFLTFGQSHQSISIYPIA